MTTRFVLYVAGDSPRSTRAAANLSRLCRSAGLPADSIEIVDVLELPDRADEAGILATPTVIAMGPHTSRRVIGDLSDIDRLASALDIVADPSPAEEPS